MRGWVVCVCGGGGAGRGRRRLHTPRGAYLTPRARRYAPAIAKQERDGADLAQKLGDLETALGRRRAHGGGVGGPSVRGVADEAEYWADAARAGRDRARAELFAEQFRLVAPKWSGIATLGWAAVLELLEDTHSVLDDVWRADLAPTEVYDQARMEQLLRAVGTAVITVVQVCAGSPTAVSPARTGVTLVSAAGARARLNPVGRGRGLTRGDSMRPRGVLKVAEHGVRAHGPVLVAVLGAPLGWRAPYRRRAHCDGDATAGDRAHCVNS